MKYKVTCLECKNNNVVPIDDARNIHWEQCDRIISGRFRLDGSWGWQCICGNNNLLTKQEASSITDKANPDPKEISEIIANLIPDTTRHFVMEAI